MLSAPRPPDWTVSFGSNETLLLISAEFTRKHAAFTRDNLKIMTRLKNNDTIMYAEPLGVIGRRRRRRYSIADYNDRSPDVGAMQARLRAATYRRHRLRPSDNADDNQVAGAIERARSFVDLSLEY